MKAVNLLSIVNARADLTQTTFELLLKNYGIGIKTEEFSVLESLVDKLGSCSDEINCMEAFFVGYAISQISKEFDLLRFGVNSIVNIELKRESTEDKIKKQLLQNAYYLSFLNKEVYNFTYVLSDKKLYYLDDEKNLVNPDFIFLIELLNDDIEKVENIDKLFNPSNYLISPFNSTDSFIEGRYFLTNQQERFKTDILKLFAKNGTRFVVITGSAGTGKTLLTYDIAKELIHDSKKVLVLHCGSLNEGHYKLRTTYHWTIASIKSISNFDLADFDVLIMDEVQRVYKNQLEEILHTAKEIRIKCIFAYDAQQCLSRWEINRRIPQYINDEVSPQIFKLNEKIRSNKEIASFIKNLFDLSKINTNQVYSNIDVRYFTNSLDAKKVIDELAATGWKHINYTPSSYTRYPYEDHQNKWNVNAHNVIGQEYDDVIAVIDQYFFYNEEGKLSTKGYRDQPYYHPTKMLFQIVTRARRRLCIIIINNEDLIKHCLKILNP
jgi:DNA replication protein